MPRLIPPALGNGKRPSDPDHHASTSDLIPVLDVCDDTHALVGDRHDAALDPDEPVGLLTGSVLILDNPQPAGAPATPDVTTFVIGGSTLHEAATEVIAAYTAHGLAMPQWVASTDPELGAVIAEHYTIDGYSACELRKMSEVSA